MAHIKTRKRRDGTKTYQVRGPGIRAATFPDKTSARAYWLDTEKRRTLGALYEAAPDTLAKTLDGHIHRKDQAGARTKTLANLREARRAFTTLDHKLVPQVRRADIEDLILRRSQTAPRCAQMELALVKAALREAKGRGQTVDDAIFEIRRPKHETREAHVLTMDEVWEVASWLPEAVRRIVPVAALTGLRQGELFALRETDLFLTEKYVQVQSGKTRAARRRVHIGDEAVGILREQLLARPPGPFVFQRDHRGWDKGSFGFLWRPAVKAAGLEGVVFHDLRKTYISLLVMAGVHVRVIAAQVGHVDGGALILRTYAHLYPGQQQEAAAALDRMVRTA